MSVIWKPTRAHTIPPSSDIVEGEVVWLVFDTIHDLGVGQTAINPSLALINIQDRDVPIEDVVVLEDPSMIGTQIIMRVDGIQHGITYELQIGFDHTNPRVAGEHTTRIHMIEGL